MRIKALIIITIIALVLASCTKESMPYKTVSDAKRQAPTGAVVGVQTDSSKEQVKEAQPQGPTCKNSDQGNYPQAFGKVSGKLDDGSDYEISDACLGNILYEYDCDGSNVIISKTKCSRGCKNGFCI